MSEFVEKALSRKVFMSLVAEMVGDEWEAKLSKSDLRILEILKKDKVFMNLLKEFVEYFKEDFEGFWYYIDSERRLMKRIYEDILYYFPKIEKGEIKYLKDLPSLLRKEYVYKEGKSLCTNHRGKLSFNIIKRLYELQKELDV